MTCLNQSQYRMQHTWPFLTNHSTEHKSHDLSQPITAQNTVHIWPFLTNHSTERSTHDLSPPITARSWVSVYVKLTCVNCWNYHGEVSIYPPNGHVLQPEFRFCFSNFIDKVSKKKILYKNTGFLGKFCIHIKFLNLGVRRYICDVRKKNMKMLNLGETWCLKKKVWKKLKFQPWNCSSSFLIFHSFLNLWCTKILWLKFGIMPGLALCQCLVTSSQYHPIQLYDHCQF